MMAVSQFPSLDVLRMSDKVNGDAFSLCSFKQKFGGCRKEQQVRAPPLGFYRLAQNWRTHRHNFRTDIRRCVLTRGDLKAL